MASRRAPAVYLHIGVMKTGTTYLQRLIWKNRKSLARHGFLVPGDAFADVAKATRDVLDITGGDPVVRKRVDGTWKRLADQMISWDGTASLFSMEFLSFAHRRKVGRLLKSLKPADVQMILTIRDTAEVLPAQWQSYARNRGTASWPEFAAEITGGVEKAEGSAAKTFLRAQNIPRMLEAWRGSLPAEKIHVVTVPPRGSSPDLLWERFAGVVGVDPAACKNREVGGNASLGQPSADLMRRLNHYVGNVPVSDYDRVMRRLAKDVLSPRSGEEGRPRINAETLSFAREWNQRVRDAVVASGARVVGDLDELPVKSPTDAAAGGLGEPDPADVLAAAVAAKDGARPWLRDIGVDAGEDGHTAAQRWNQEPDPLQTAVEDVARDLRRVMGRG